MLILNHGYSAAPLDKLKAGRAIVQHAGEHHAHHARPFGHGRRSEQGIVGGTIVVFAGAFGHEQVPNAAVLGQQVVAGRGQVRSAGFNGFAGDG